MIFHLEPTGMGIRIVLPGHGESTISPSESVSWIVRPVGRGHPRLRNNTELTDVAGRAVVKRSCAGQDRRGRVYWGTGHELSGAGAEQYVVELRAGDDVFDRIVALAREGKPPTLVLEPDGVGRVWDKDVDPQITLSGWRAEIQVTAEEKRESAGPPSLVEARLAQIQSSIASARIAAWAAVVATALLVLLRLR